MRVARVALADAVTDRLFFAQVREDSRLDVEVLSPRPDEEVAVVGSAGCTALALAAAGARHVWSVDLNRTQHHLVELKRAALLALDAPAAAAFLGAAPATHPRAATYAGLRPLLTNAARACWDGRPSDIVGGVLAAGVSERFIRMVVGVMRRCIHPRARIDRLLACRTLDEQAALYAREWNGRRWRALFHLLLNRAVFRRTYDPAFFRHVENASFARHFHRLVEHGLTALPVADNYFLHHMLTGRYPLDVPGGAPSWLTRDGAARVAARPAALTLVDGGFTAFLRTRADRSLHGFALSNIAEWLDAAGFDALLAEVRRTAAPGARLVFRNFVGHTTLPERWRDTIVEDGARSADLSRRDRSLLQARLVACRVMAS